MRNMVPMSTALWDPSWYHEGQDPMHLFLDKRGILNGLRLEQIVVQDECEYMCPCEAKDPTKCRMFESYRQELDKIDFRDMINNIQAFADWYKNYFHIKEEIIMVLIVYESPKNKCSERQTLIEYFNDNGVDCKELEYPIGG